MAEPEEEEPDPTATEEVETKDKGEEIRSDSAILYKKETRTRKSYGVSRVQVMPGLSADYSTGYEEQINYTSCVPVLSEETGGGYTPMTYIFRIPQFDMKKKVKNLSAKSPPFHILFDHTLAVIWVLLADGTFTCPLGIAQLHWAHNFLKTIRKRNGLPSEDIQIMLQLMQETLRKAYAQLNAELEKIDNANKGIKCYDVFGSPSDILETHISLNYEEMKTRGEEVINVNKGEREPPLSEEELKQKIDLMIEEMDDFEHLDQSKREQLIKDFIKYKEQIQKRCDEQMETLLAIQGVMKEVNPELFPPEPPNPCKDQEPA